MLDQALKGNYAVGHFDIHNLEWTQAVLTAAQETLSPVILGVTEEAVNYSGGFKVVKEIAISLIKEMDITVPVALHLDNGSNVENICPLLMLDLTQLWLMVQDFHLKRMLKWQKNYWLFTSTRSYSWSRIRKY